MREKIRAWALLLCVLATGAALLIFPDETQAALRASLIYCLTVLAPSLFPFMALASFAVQSGAGRALAGPLGGLVRRAFRLPGGCGLSILMGLLGGYPAGAKGAALLLERGAINEEQAGRMLLFCVNPGPAFVVGFAGGMLGGPQVGWRLFLSGTAASLLLGLLTAIGKPLPPREPEERFRLGAGALIRSVSDASRSLLTMCACIVLFQGLQTLLIDSGAAGLLCRGLSAAFRISPMESAVLLSFLTEVTGGLGAAQTVGAPAALYAFGLGFGGLCVHLQLVSFFREFPVAKGKFLLFRLLHGLLAATLYTLWERLLPGPALTAAAQEGARPSLPLSGSLAGGLSLLLMSAVFLLITDRDGRGIAQSEKL